MTMHMGLIAVGVEKDLPYTQLADEVAVAVAAVPAPVPQRSSAIDRTKFKTKLCKNWVNGTECPYGARCVFAHGKHEKREEGDVLRESEGTLSNLSTPLESSLVSRTEVVSWDMLESSSGSVMNAAAPAYYPQMYQENVVQYQEVPQPQQPQQPMQMVQQLPHMVPPMPVDHGATCYRYEPYGCDVVTRVPVAAPIPLRRTATNESHGLTDVSSDC